MRINDILTQVRHDRSARRAVRVQRETLTRELAAYSTPAERLEIEMLAARTPGGEMVLDILQALPAAEWDYRSGLRRAA